MSTRSWRAMLAARKLRPGDGQSLPPYRWWNLLTRSLLLLQLEDEGGHSATYAVDVRHLGDPHDGAVRARLYRNNQLEAHSTLPARFPVPGGHIEVAVGTYGMRRCHFVPASGEARQLEPHPRTAEGRRARLHRRFPRFSTLLGVVTTGVVFVALCIALPQLIETVTHVPQIAEEIGAFTSPIHLTPLGNAVVAAAAVAASTERALRFRSTWLDNLAS